jgi:hypothetical protein
MGWYPELIFHLWLWVGILNSSFSLDYGLVSWTHLSPVTMGWNLELIFLLDYGLVSWTHLSPLTMPWYPKLTIPLDFGLVTWTHLFSWLWVGILNSSFPLDFGLVSSTELFPLTLGWYPELTTPHCQWVGILNSQFPIDNGLYPELIFSFAYKLVSSSFPLVLTLVSLTHHSLLTVSWYPELTIPPCLWVGILNSPFPSANCIFGWHGPGMHGLNNIAWFYESNKIFLEFRSNCPHYFIVNDNDGKFTTAIFTLNFLKNTTWPKWECGSGYGKKKLYGFGS